jgi:hypothetical protein
VAHHQRHGRVRTRAAHPLGRGEAVRDRLLDEHVPAVLGARERLLLVDVVRRDEQDALDLRVSDRGLQARGRLAAEAFRELAPPRLVTAEAGDELQLGARRRLREPRRPHARPDDGDSAHPSCSRSQSAATGRVL